MSLRDHSEQTAYELWRDRLALACSAHGLPEPDDCAMRWFTGPTDIAAIVAELAGRKAA